MLEATREELRSLNRACRAVIPGWPWIPISAKLARQIAADKREERRAGAERQRAYRARKRL